jgi:hypothetical protein
MQLDTFKGLLGNGGVRANQFRITLTTPDGSLGDYNLLVTGASLPSSNINPTVVQYRGREIKFAGERTFDPFTVTIVNDNAFTIHGALMNWMEMINGANSNEGVTDWQSYTQQLIVEQLTREQGDSESALATYTLEGAFPINVSEIALNYGQNDTVEEFTVTFQYQYYTYESGSGQAGL